jgi:2-amino-4-hydroxy-6-hydroxymethyldihydropteridine diphosphokinase
MQVVYLLLGSNLGDRKTYLKEASVLLEKAIGLITQRSSIYETAAWGVEDLPDYLNQVLEMETNLSPENILEKTQGIEEKLLRTRTNKWHSRTIDIDILFYGTAVIDLPNLKIPHPEIQNRLFTLTPLNELVPDYIHPVLKKTIHELKQHVNDKLPVKIYLEKD